MLYFCYKIYEEDLTVSLASSWGCGLVQSDKSGHVTHSWGMRTDSSGHITKSWEYGLTFQDTLLRARGTD